jgi:hypothetical protein
MSPEVGLSSVIAKRRTVVFPEPLGPIRVTFSPGMMSRSRSIRTWLGPKALDTLVN